MTVIDFRKACLVIEDIQEICAEYNHNDRTSCHERTTTVLEISCFNNHHMVVGLCDKDAELYRVGIAAHKYMCEACHVQKLLNKQLKLVNDEPYM